MKLNITTFIQSSYQSVYLDIFFYLLTLRIAQWEKKCLIMKKPFREILAG